MFPFEVDEVISRDDCHPRIFVDMIEFVSGKYLN